MALNQNRSCNLIFLGDESSTKKSHIVTKICSVNSAVYNPSSITTVSILITSSNTYPPPKLIINIHNLNISHDYDLTKNKKSSDEKSIKLTYNNGNIIFHSMSVIPNHIRMSENTLINIPRTSKISYDIRNNHCRPHLSQMGFI